MKKVVYGLLAAAFFGTAACDNAASKIKSGDDEKQNSSQQQSSQQQSGGDVSAQDMNSEGTPQFSFEEETHNFGKIKEGKVAKHDFTFTNSGDAPLIITNASGSCGCTVPQWPREPIAPGETGTIHVEFSSEGRTGNQNKQVTISANTQPNKKILRISAEVEPKEGKEAKANS